MTVNTGLLTYHHSRRGERVSGPVDPAAKQVAFSAGGSMVQVHGSLLWQPQCPLLATDQQGDVMQVVVRDNNVEQALRVLKKKMQREGVFREMKARRAYEKPSERKIRQRAEAVRRSHKLARKRAQKEGLLPPSKTKAPLARKPSPGAERTGEGWAKP